EGAAAADGAASDAAATAATTATDGAATNAATTASKRLPMSHHVTAPSFHALGTLVSHVMFGSPWVGEAVKNAKAIRDSNPTPTSPSGSTDTTATALATTTGDTTALPTPPPPVVSGSTPAPFANPSAAPRLVRPSST